MAKKPTSKRWLRTLQAHRQRRKRETQIGRLSLSLVGVAGIWRLEGLRRHLRDARSRSAASERDLIARARQQMTDVSNPETILEASQRRQTRTRADEQELELKPRVNSNPD